MERTPQLAQTDQLDLFDAADYEPITQWHCYRCDWTPNATNNTATQQQVREHVTTTGHPMIPAPKSTPC